MSFDIAPKAPKKIDFTYGDKQLYVRGLTLSLGLKLQSIPEDQDISAELIAEIVAASVVDKNGARIFVSAEEALGMDLEPMLKLFSEVSSLSVKPEEAEKN